MRIAIAAALMLLAAAGTASRSVPALADTWEFDTVIGPRRDLIPDQPEPLRFQGSNNYNPFSEIDDYNRHPEYSPVPLPSYRQELAPSQPSSYRLPALPEPEPFEFDFSPFTSD